MNIEIRDAALEARIQKQLEVTGSSRGLAQLWFFSAEILQLWLPQLSRFSKAGYHGLRQFPVPSHTKRLRLCYGSPMGVGPAFR